MLLTAVVIALLYWFFGTEQGSALRATGANQSMARAQGINTNTAKVLGLVVSNGLVALAGGLLAQYQGSANIDMGRGAIVIGLAAVIIGEVLLGKVFRNFALKLLSVRMGAIIYYVVITVVLRLGLEPTDLKLLTALVVAVFLAVPYWKGRYFTKPARRKGGCPPCLKLREYLQDLQRRHHQREAALERCHPHPRTKGTLSPSSAATARASPPCSIWWRASTRWTAAPSPSAGRM